MKKNIKILFTFALLLFSSISLAASDSINDYTIMTEDYPPFNYSDGDDVKGLAAEIFSLTLRNLNSTKTSKNFEILPWARSYKDIQSLDNTILFSMTRTAERENMFKWVGPIAPTKISIMTLKSKGIKISDFTNLGSYRIGTVRDDIGELLLLSNNFPKEYIKSVAKLENNISKLDADRIDLISYEENVLKWTIKQEGKKLIDYETVFILKESEVFYAFNKNTPDSLIKQVQEAFDKVKNSPEYQQILDKYLK